MTKEPSLSPALLVRCSQPKASCTFFTPHGVRHDALRPEPKKKATKDSSAPRIINNKKAAAKHEAREAWHRLSSVAVSPFRDLAMCGGPDGRLRVLILGSGRVYKDLTGHVGDISTCSFFPNGKIGLSGSSDMTIKIWALEHAQCVKTFGGHRLGVTRCSFLECASGKRFASSSRDGTMKVWDCSRSEAIATYTAEQKGSSLPCSINDCAHAEGVLYGGDDMGRIMAVDLRQKQRQQQLGYHLHLDKTTVLKSGINGISADDRYVYAAFDDGTLVCADRRKPGEAVSASRKSDSPVTRIVPTATNGEHIVSSSDGSCSIWMASAEGHGISGELLGPDCEPVSDVALHDLRGQGVGGLLVVTTARDGAVRSYQL
uniref:Guanine nucleotide-binding protein subunit beta-like protein n=1 Tax=Lotharella globosa TaxID=91324 RepID=A0A7S3ZBH0_9EUKA|mmetsp:Transcript_10470/g.20205  ORF Transcript_10470/g.20205 Transcript_10470/m.20205 type:complete len:373 (+) Transcript_10470:224-1342(+)|eukprot:CAMPEP_0167774198 /NCGR_PEP_ID=MMETSP0111_2-20121227/1861_1 /TAXON_ID=91324 /ORGANISM="Lotharella globosa, Strain CCCM811" /LENGTH=372 /DNA_ID=CAMNT_0007663957 /DNA_START=174 /DNA_END=1292 /DNA_ORIENTATION=-